MTRDVAVICTRNRPELAARAATQLLHEQAFEHVVIVDGSDDDDAQHLVELLASEPGAEIVRTDPGLARQRNAGARHVLDRTDAELIWWFDDDGDVQLGYRDAIAGVFAEDSQGLVGGAGGRVLDARLRPTGLVARARNGVKRFFLLHGEEGRVLRSGRNIQVTSPGSPLDVQWIQGCAATYRRQVLTQFRWDDRLTGYSWGEDFDFSYRVGHTWRLKCVPDAVVVNGFSEIGRWSTQQHAATRTVLTHAWVREQPSMSTVAFWWSLLGEVIYVTTLTLFRLRSHGVDEVRGLLSGILVIMRRRGGRGFLHEPQDADE